MLRIGTLQALREGDGQRADEKRVFAVRLFSSPPSRVATQIGVRSTNNYAAPIEDWILVVVPRLISFQGADLPDEIRIPRRAESLFLRKRRGRHRLPAATSPPRRTAQRQSMKTLYLAGKDNPQTGNLRMVRHQIDFLFEGQAVQQVGDALVVAQLRIAKRKIGLRSEEHTSELQS